MSIKLTAKEREAMEWLKDFSTKLLDGEPVVYQEKIINQLERMGVNIKFVSHKDVSALKRGKTDHYLWHITSGEWYIRGQVSKRYLPFQIKEFKK